jgi:phosphohistidine phosphatase SixA
VILVGLLRHGVAEDAGPQTGWQDAPRALTDEGRVRMSSAAAGITRLGFTFDAIVASPLVRCAQTAEIVGAELGVPPALDERLRPGFDIARLCDIVLEHPEAEAILLCGHQPDLSNVTWDLTGGWVGFKKGALAMIELDEPRPRAGVLVGLYPPSALRKLAPRR